MKNIIALVLLTIGINLPLLSQKSKDGSKTISGTEIVNEYTSLTTDASSGDLSISVSSSSLNSNGRFSSGLEEGDLLYIIQIQGATIESSNGRSSGYGAVTNYNNCGLSEYVEVSGVPNATTVELGCPLQNDYTSAGKVVVVRVPRYATLNIPVGTELTGDTWDGTIGGVAVFEVEGDVTLNGEVSMSEKGFRGTPSTGNLGSPGGIWNDYATTDGSKAGLKGEGIAGYHSDYDALNGRYGQGSAANAGGGGCSVDAGGGGGANAGDINNYTGKGNPDTLTDSNYILAWEQEAAGFSMSSSSGGGRGGYCKSDNYVDPYTNGLDDYGLWGSDGRRDNATGFGGRPLDYSTSRLFLGGGGGQGHGTNQNSGGGGAGGGLVIIKTDGAVNGTGSILVIGQAGEGNVGSFFNPDIDGAGGAGAGGSVVIEAISTISNINIEAYGGQGGTVGAYVFRPNINTGPGGGGGGGYVRTSSAGANIDVSGGGNGLMILGNFDGVFEPNGATYGGAGESVVSPVLPIVITTENDTVCAGETAALEAQGSNLNGATLTWYDAYYGGNIIGIGTSFSIPNLTSDSTVYVGACPGYSKVAVLAKVNSALNGDVVLDTVYACSGSSARMEAIGGNSYSWYPSADLDQDDQSVANITTTSSQMIYVDISLNGTCVYTDSVYVSITPNLTVDLGADKFICEGDSVDLNASGGTNYVWSPNTAISSLSDPTATVDPTVTTKYFVTVDDGAGCSGEDSILVNVIPALSITIPSLQELCKDEVVNLSASYLGGSGGSVTYLWDEGVYSGANQSLSWGANGSMEVKVVDDTYGCQDSATFGVLVRELSADFNYSDTCLGDQTALSSLGTVSAGNLNNYVWLINNVTPLLGSAVSTQLPFSGSNEIAHVVIDDLGCTDTVVKFITTQQPPLATINVVPDTVCVGYEVKYSNAYLGSSSYDFDWDLGNGATSDQDSGTTSYSLSNTYYIDFSLVDDNGCSASTTDSVFVKDGPLAGFNLPETVKLGEDITPVNTTVGGQIYTWTIEGDTVSNDESPVFSADRLGEKCFKLFVLSQAGCGDSYEGCVEIEGEELLIPNVFTPNSDGQNDYLEFVNAEGKSFRVQVYNRWGALVYESSDYKGDWSGLGKSGEELSEGTYYIVAQEISNANSALLNGFIFLTR